MRVHITFLLFLVWIFAADYASGGPDEAWTGLLFMVLLFACVLAHEFGHIFTARAFGVATPDVTLLPIGGVARLERIPEEPREEFLIAIAGPAVNVVIALALVALAGAHLDVGTLGSVDNARISMVDRLAAVNLFLALFNMIPAFPMDGGRVLRAALASRMGPPRHRGRGRDRPGGRLRARLHRLVLQPDADLHRDLRLSRGLFGGAYGGAARHVARRPGQQRDDDAVRNLTPEAHVDEAVQTLLRTSQGEFPVVDGAGKPVGLLGRGDLIRAIKQRGPDARVADVDEHAGA